MRGMAYVHISEDGRSATIGGGSQSGEVIAALWARGKQAGIVAFFYLSATCFNMVFDLSPCIILAAVY